MRIILFICVRLLLTTKPLPFILIKRWTVFPHSLNWALPCDLFWSTECVGVTLCNLKRSASKVLRIPLSVLENLKLPCE